MAQVELLENERIDDLGRRGFRIIQNSTKFCFGIDAVLLSWFTQVKEGQEITDLGTGTGIIPLMLLARNETGHYTGLEIQEDMAEMAARSVLLNDAAADIRIVTGDIKEASAIFGKGVFDVVTTNPPYMPKGNGLVNPDSGKAVSRHEILCTLSDVIREAALLLKTGGTLSMVHRPERLPEILALMKANNLAADRLCFVHPYADKDATMVLLSGKKGGRCIPKTEPPLIVYESPGIYTEKIREIYGDGRH